MGELFLTRFNMSGNEIELRCCSAFRTALALGCGANFGVNAPSEGAQHSDPSDNHE